MIQNKYIAARMCAPSNILPKVDTVSSVSPVKLQRATAGHREGPGSRSRDPRDGGH